MKTPKENPSDKAARYRDRRIIDIKRQKFTQEIAADLTSDLRAMYGLNGLTGTGGTMAAAPVKLKDYTTKAITALYSPKGLSMFGGAI